MYLKKPQQPHTKTTKKNHPHTKHCPKLYWKITWQKKIFILLRITTPIPSHLVHSHPAVVITGLITHDPWLKVCFPSGAFAIHKTSENFPNGGWLLFKANLGLWAGISPGTSVGNAEAQSCQCDQTDPSRAATKAQPCPALPSLMLITAATAQLRGSPNPQPLNARF